MARNIGWLSRIRRFNGIAAGLAIAIGAGMSLYPETFLPLIAYGLIGLGVLIFVCEFYALWLDRNPFSRWFDVRTWPLIRRLFPVIFSFGGYYLGMTKSGDFGPVMVSSFQGRGINNTGHVIKDIESFIQSELTGEIRPVWANVRGDPVPFEETNGIPPNAQFSVVAAFAKIKPSELSGVDSRIHAQQFLGDFGSFRFVFRAPRIKCTRRFSLRKSRNNVSKFSKQVEPDIRPGVRRNSG